MVDHDLAGVWALGWLYSAGVIGIGIGLHTFLKRWTTLAMMVLFVMLTFTSSGGVYRPELQSGFFGGLHSFWAGAGFLEGARSLLYFDGGAGFGGHLLTLVLWLAAAGVLVVGAALYERRGRAALSSVVGAGPVDGAGGPVGPFGPVGVARGAGSSGGEGPGTEEEMEESAAAI